MTVKRVLDILAAGGALVLMSPLLGALALLVALDSPGPVFFRQERVGRAGVPFTLLKFRTMRDAPAMGGGLLTLAEDGRVTRVGRWLRRTKLDELPQLVNVIRGEMSIVGPRPEVARYVAFYPPHLRDVVLSVRPGLTDFASIEYRNEADSLTNADDAERVYIDEILPAKLALNCKYVRERSLALDARLAVRTIRALYGPSSRS